MKIGSIHHIAINTKNIVESSRFYRDILGLKQGKTVHFEEFDLTYFDLPAGGSLELFDYHGRNSERTRADDEPGLRHLAFTVEGVAQHEKTLREAGVKITLPTTELPQLGSRVLLFLDPNGVTIEFCERL
jgi:catechol 2,3-dioxygenase-like lactoylglutathione lyase family enzyme